MRISDWSSDVCSSDLDMRFVDEVFLLRLAREQNRQAESGCGGSESCRSGHCGPLGLDQGRCAMKVGCDGPYVPSWCTQRSEERRVGKECVSKCRSRG